MSELNPNQSQDKTSIIEEIERFANREAEFNSLSTEAQNMILSTQEEPEESTEDAYVEIPVQEDVKPAEDEKGDTEGKKSYTEEELLERLKQLEERHKDLQTKYRDKSNLANTAEQRVLAKLKSDEEYRKKALSEFIADKKPAIKSFNVDNPDFDPYEENNQKEVYKTIEYLKKEVEDSKKMLYQYADEQKQKVEIENKFSEINSLQEQYKEVATTIPFRKINDIYAKVWEENGRQDVSVEQMAEAGINKGDWEKALKIYDLLDKRNYYPDLKSAFRDIHFDEYLNNYKNTLTTNANQALNKQAEAFESKIHKIKNDPKVITNVSAENNMNGEFNYKEAEAFLLKYNDIDIRNNPELYEKWKYYMIKLGITT